MIRDLFRRIFAADTAPRSAPMDTAPPAPGASYSAEDTQEPAPTTGRRLKLTGSERLALIERQAAKRPLHCRAAWKRTHMMMAKGR